MGAQGGIGSALVRVGRGIGSAIGRVATSRVGRTAIGATGIGGAIAGAAIPSLTRSRTVGKYKVNPTKIFPGGKPFIERKKYRRMNAANIKALKRAIRRVDAFKKVAAQVGLVPRKTSTMAKVHVTRRRK